MHPLILHLSLFRGCIIFIPLPVKVTGSYCTVSVLQPCLQNPALAQKAPDVPRKAPRPPERSCQDVSPPAQLPRAAAEPEAVQEMSSILSRQLPREQGNYPVHPPPPRHCWAVTWEHGSALLLGRGHSRGQPLASPGSSSWAVQSHRLLPQLAITEYKCGFLCLAPADPAVPRGCPGHSPCSSGMEGRGCSLHTPTAPAAEGKEVFIRT